MPLTGRSQKAHLRAHMRRHWPVITHAVCFFLDGCCFGGDTHLQVVDGRGRQRADLLRVTEAHSFSRSTNGPGRDGRALRGAADALNERARRPMDGLRRVCVERRFSILGQFSSCVYRECAVSIPGHVLRGGPPLDGTVCTSCTCACLHPFRNQTTGIPRRGAYGHPPHRRRAPPHGAAA